LRKPNHWLFNGIKVKKKKNGNHFLEFHYKQPFVQWKYSTDGVLYGIIDIPSICPLYTVETVSGWEFMFQPTKKESADHFIYAKPKLT